MINKRTGEATDLVNELVAAMVDGDADVVVAVEVEAGEEVAIYLEPLFGGGDLELVYSLVELYGFKHSLYVTFSAKGISITDDLCKEGKQVGTWMLGRGSYKRVVIINDKHKTLQASMFHEVHTLTGVRRFSNKAEAHAFVQAEFGTDHDDLWMVCRDGEGWFGKDYFYESSGRAALDSSVTEDDGETIEVD
jgi:hypothetical protein